MIFKKLNKIIGTIFGVFTICSSFANVNVLARGNVLEVCEKDIPSIVMNVSYKERLLDLGTLNQYGSLYSILESISSKLGFECFCGLDCFEEHLCTYKKRGLDSLSIILRGLNDKLDKQLTRDILSFFSQINKYDTASNINFYYTTV